MGSLLGGNTAAHDTRTQQINSDMAEQARQAAVMSGTGAVNGTFGQFNDGFYNNIRQGYLDYANPQLQDQYADARKQLTYALDRSGMLDSSTRSQQEASLQKQFNANAQSVADQAQGYANNARNSVESARNNLLSQINDSGSAQAAANNAIGQAASLSAAPSYSPLGAMFSDITSAAATQAQLEKNEAMFGKGAGGAYNTGLFGVRPGTVKTSGS